MRRILNAYGMVLIMLVCWAPVHLHAMPQLRIGTAKVDITPQQPIQMAGYQNRTDPSKGVRDPLHARVLVMDVDGVRVAVISCDLIGYYNHGILDIARKRFDIPHVLVCSSHTHSGPSLGEDTSDYAKFVESTLEKGLETATGNMTPAVISAGYRSFPQLGYNRLSHRGDGPAIWRDYERIPYGPVDPEVGVMKINDLSGNTRAILMAYGCHAVCNGGNYEISADYPGAAARKVEQAYGNGAICMFIQGGAGNVNPMFMSSQRGKDGNPPTDYTPMETMGSLLGEQVLNVAQSLNPSPENASLLVMSDSLKFTGRYDKTLTFDVQFTTLIINNAIGICTFPGEPHIAHQLFWKNDAPVSYPFFFGYTFSAGGEAPGYVPDVHTAAYGGYGADASPRMIEVGAGENIMLRHLENMYRLLGIMQETPPE